MRTLVLCLVTVLTMGTDALAARKFTASSFEKTAFEGLDGSLNNIRRQASDLPAIRDAVDRGRDRLRYLNSLRRQHDVPREYVESVNELSSLLTDIMRADMSPADKAEVIREVVDDLETKAQCARKRLNPIDDPPPFDNVAIGARTLSQGNEVSGQEVWYVLRGWARFGKQTRFLELSSPAKHVLAPGNYYFWSAKGEATGKKARIDLGSNGELKVALDLEAP
jgi:hypothetical protein